MHSSVEEVGLENLNQELQSMEKILKKADEYNDTLTKRINKLRTIVSSNQKVFQQLKSNEECMQELLNDDNNKEIVCNKLLQKVGSIENKLFVTVNLFNEYKRRVEDKSCVQDDNVELKLCKQLNALGTSLIRVSKQIAVLHEEKLDKKCDASKNLHDGFCSVTSEASNESHWAQCNTHVQMSHFTVLQGSEEMPIRQIRCQKRIIERVETILEKAQVSNIRSDTFASVKLLAKMILGVLVKRNHKLCFLDDMNHKVNQTITEKQSCNPYL